MFTLKKQFSHNANRVMGHNELNRNFFDEGGQALARLPESDQSPQYKMDLYVEKLFYKFNRSKIVLPKFYWQSSYHDHIIRNEKDFYAHYEYITQNYKKHDNEPDKRFVYNYPENYRFTSINFEGMLDKIF